MVCRDTNYKYRVYECKRKGEKSSEIKSLQPKRTCKRRYKNSIVSSRWIADRPIEKFVTEPNISISALLGKVKDRWEVDAPDWQLYAAQRMVKERIQGK